MASDFLVCGIRGGDADAGNHRNNALGEFHHQEDNVEKEYY
jgi:hypothetical protein